MATTIIGGNAQLSIEAAETGINVSSFKVRYYPEIDAKLAGITGETIIRGRSSDFSRDVSISGEVTGSDGLMAVTLTSAVSVANDAATFGGAGGGLYLQDVTETQTRGENWRSIDMNLTSNPLLSD